MIGVTRRIRRLMADRQGGFTLVELLVAMGLFTVLVTITMPALISTRDSTDTTKAVNDANEEARVALNRMSRELRQASEIRGATLFTSGPYATAGFADSLTFGVDFNGNGTIEANAVDAEILTYRFVPDVNGAGNGQIQLSANDPSGTLVVRPILAAHVSDFHMELRSSLWQCDKVDPITLVADGVTTWQEVDTNTAAACPSPDNNGTLGTNEFNQLDSVVVAFTVFEGTYEQTYRAQIDLRNVGL